jgi:F0F1-type ATP synthase assembly protein I
VYRGVNLRLLGLVGQVGLTVVVLILIGLVAGQWIDGRLNTSPAFTLFFIFLGMAAGLWGAYRLTMWALQVDTHQSVDGED